tara:strand:- start:30761 stop:32401 length:1641 start_codon:yes stop_codon:yes gene_type:complete
MLGSYASTFLSQVTYHFIPLDKKSRTPGLEEFSLYYTSLPEQHNTIKLGYWHKNPYLNYKIIGETGIQVIGVDLESQVGSLGLNKILSPTGVDLETTVGDLTALKAINMPGVDAETEVGSVFIDVAVNSVCRTGHELTNFFLAQQQKTNPESIVRQFTFNNSILSSRVTEYSSVTRNYKEVVAGGFSVRLENASKLMNEIIEDRTKFRKDGEISYGYQFNPTHIDFGCVGKGELIEVDYDQAEVNMQFKNKLDNLSEIKVSTDLTSRQGASFVGSVYNPADLTFDILTSNSYGAQLDNTTSPANADINYNSWLDWKNSLGSESIVVQAFFPVDLDYVRALQGIAETTDSAIYVESNNKLTFLRKITGAESFSATVNDEDIISITAKGDAFDMANEFTVPISFTVASNSVTGFRQTITFQNTASVNSFGKISKTTTQNVIWYVDSASALNLAQRIVGRRRRPEVALTVKTPLKYMQQQLGDLIFVTHDALNLNDEPFTMIGQTIDIMNQTITMDLSVGHGLAIANLIIFELDDAELGVLDSSAGLLA